MRLLVDAYTDSDPEPSTRSFHFSLSTEETLLLLANGREQAFVSGGFQPVIDLIYTSFVTELQRSSSIEVRLSRAIGSIRKRMVERFPVSPTAHWGEEAYSGVFIAAVVKDKYLYLTWIGSPQAKLFRKQRCVNSTAPDVHIDPNGFVITTKSISSQNNAPIENIILDSWQLQGQDTIVLADHRLFTGIPNDQIAQLLAQEKGQPAKVLVEQSQRIRYQVAQSALIAHVSQE